MKHSDHDNICLPCNAWPADDLPEECLNLIVTTARDISTIGQERTTNTTPTSPKTTTTPTRRNITSASSIKDLPSRQMSTGSHGHKSQTQPGSNLILSIIAITLFITILVLYSVKLYKNRRHSKEASADEPNHTGRFFKG